MEGARELVDSFFSLDHSRVRDEDRGGAKSFY